MSDERSEDEIVEEVAGILGLDEAGVDALKLGLWESHEKAQHLLDAVGALGYSFAIKQGDDIFVNASWLATVMLMEADQTMRGHGGCADHMRVLDLLETTVMAAQKQTGEI